MQRALSINREGVVNLEALSAVPEGERLRVAKALVAAAYELIPKRNERDDMITPAAFELATVCNSAVQALLQTAAEYQRACEFAAMREREELGAVNGTLN